MQRLRHIAFSWLAGISFLLLLLTSALWPASHYRRLTVQNGMHSADLKHNSYADLYIDLYPGAIKAAFNSYVEPATRYDVERRLESGVEARSLNMTAEWDSYTESIDPMDHEFCGFGYGFSRGGGAKDEIIEGAVFGSINPIRSLWLGCHVPLWFLIVLEAALPALYVRRALRSYRQRKYGLCVKCNYDLRASPDICPECGAKRSEYVLHKRHLLTEIALVASAVTLLLAGPMWAVSDLRAFQVRASSKLEKSDSDIDRDSMLTFAEGVCRVEGSRETKPLMGKELKERQKDGPSIGSVQVEATWQPRDERGYFNVYDDIDPDHLFHRFGYTIDHGTRPVTYKYGFLLPVKWLDARVQCPIWFVVLLGVLFPVYTMARLGVRRMRRVKA